VIPRAVVFVHENRNGSAKMKARQPGLAYGDGLLAREQPNENAWLRSALQAHPIEKYNSETMDRRNDAAGAMQLSQAWSSPSAS
jgi:hypothetical protein